MKTVSILITNRDSYEAIQLCVESVRNLTHYPYEMIVFDDCSKNGIDLEYLRAKQEAGWLTLVENYGPPLTHGGSLNVLVNDLCHTDYAVILDCDTFIRTKGWLSTFVSLAESEKNLLAIVDTKQKGYTWKGFRTPIYHFWFGFLDMRLYKDGMIIDWRNTVEDASHEPYRSLFADLLPPEKNSYFLELEHAGRIDRKRWRSDVVSNDVGAKLWLKVTYDNPKDYRVIGLTSQLRMAYHHFGHGAIVGNLANTEGDGYDSKQARKKFAEIKSHLGALRCRA